MTTSDWLIILAILIGPILAVQIQKWIASWKEAKVRKVNLFKTLMSTRASTLHPRHVEALNMIDLEFSTKKPKEKKVIDAWKIYLDHLLGFNIKSSNPDYKLKLEQWTEKSNTFLIEMLYVMALSLDYEFDKVHLKRGAYIPKGHTTIDLELKLIRRFIVELFMRKKSLPVEIVSESLEKNDQPSENET